MHSYFNILLFFLLSFCPSEKLLLVFCPYLFSGKFWEPRSSRFCFVAYCNSECERGTSFVLVERLKTEMFQITPIYKVLLPLLPERVYFPLRRGNRL